MKTFYGIIVAFFTLLLFAVFAYTEKSEICKQSLFLGMAENGDFKRELIEAKLKGVEKNVLKLLSDEDVRKCAIDSNEESCAIALKRLQDAAESNLDYMQVRLLDKLGMERIRIDRQDENGFVSIIPESQLQDKSNRYYTQEVKRLREGSVWVSPLDLNIEHGKLDIPYRPVIRVGSPLYQNGEYQGYVIINVFMKSLLNKISESKIYDVYLVDSEGYFILHPQAQNCWSRYGTDKHSIYTLFEKDIRFMAENAVVPTEDVHTLSYVLPFHIGTQMLRLVLTSKENTLKEIRHSVISSLAASGITTLAIVILLLIAINILRKNKNSEGR